MKNSLVFLIFMKYCKKKKRFSYDLFCEYLLQWDKDSVFKQKHGKFLADLARVGDEALLAWDGPGLGRGFPKSMLLNDTDHEKHMSVVIIGGHFVQKLPVDIVVVQASKSIHLALVQPT